jgi:DNA-binding MarR family transcriptional regulator
MSKKQDFISFVEQLMEVAGIDTNSDGIPESVNLFWESFKGQDEAEKPMFTDNGKLILTFLKDHQDTVMWKARDIAEEMFISSRAVSGAMRKLVTDGFVEKIGKEPVVYTLTDAGKNIVIE